LRSLSARLDPAQRWLPGAGRARAGAAARGAWVYDPAGNEDLLRFLCVAIRAVSPRPVAPRRSREVTPARRAW
jgi:hypothetical protein